MPAPPTIRRAAALALALGLPLGVAACGGTDHSPTAAVARTTTLAATAGDAATLLDTKHVERAIVASVKAQRKVTARVTCPTTVLQEKGVLFHCTARSSIGKATFVVTQTDDRGHVVYVAK